MAPGLRLLVLDRSCRWPRLPLTHFWRAGAWLYRALGRLDRARGVTSWEEALRWLTTVEPDRPIAEVQVWSHGRWGMALLQNEPLDRHALRSGHPLQPLLLSLRQRLLGPESLLWFRTCETFGARPGHYFAQALAELLECRVAGHTHIIGFWQSGLHSLRPGQAPSWPVTEGIRRGSPEAPERARHSFPGRPHTISCLRGRIPDGY